MSNTTYYAYIDKVEPAGEEQYFEFHCLDKSLADSIIDFLPIQFQAVLSDTRSQVITLTNSIDAIQKIFPVDDITNTESNWVILATDDHTGLEAFLFVENAPEETAILISAITPFPPDSATERKLLDKVSLDDYEDAAEESIKTLLERNKSQTPEFIAIYDVGQGNSNAVCNQQCQPLLYFDLGGGCYKNKKTYPTALNFCFTHAPCIILSHWDMDHFQTAQMNSHYRSKDWIVPRQKLGPVHLKFYRSITGMRLIWPASLPSLAFCWGEIVVCTGPAGKKNHTGLSYAASINPMVNTIRDVLLPADAAYTYIPGAALRKNFDGLIATHHGAEFDTVNHPVPASKGQKANVYSFGKPNTYSHPRVPATTAHISSGWPHAERKNTWAGHIALADNPGSLTLGCAAGHCDLAIVQQY